MAGRYELWLTTDKGVQLASLDGVLRLQCSRVVNGIGWMEVQLPISFDTSLIGLDRMVQVWREPTGGRLKLWRVYLIRRWQYSTLETGQKVLHVWGPDVNDLLRRRIVAHYSTSSNADKSKKADNMMKDIVTDAIANGSNPAPMDGTRVWSNLSVAGDVSDGPSIAKSFAWRRLLEPGGGGLLVDLAAAAKEAGTEVYFDVVPDAVSATSITFQFRTYTGQPGMDVSERVVFEEGRNLSNAFLEYDYSEEVNYVYAAGQGQGDQRNIQQVYDADRYGQSQWNRCEAYADARDQELDHKVREAGRAILREGRPVRRFGGTPLDVSSTRFGRDWDFGDRVTARYLNEQFEAIVWAVVLSMEPGSESVQARLEYDEGPSDQIGMAIRETVTGAETVTVSLP